MPVSPDLLDPDRGDPCAGSSHTTILATYAAPQGRPEAEGDRIPLRCGRPDARRQEGWGYRHFVNRWAGRTQSFSDDIAITLHAGRRERANRGTVRYEHTWASDEGVVHRAMTIVVSLRAQQPDGGIRGIITAFWWGSSGVRAAIDGAHMTSPRATPDAIAVHPGHTGAVAMDELPAPLSLRELAGRQLDNRSPALIVHSARELNQADIEDLVRRGAEDRDLLEGSGPALEVVFSLAGEPGPWVWRLRLHEDDVPEGEADEYFAEELAWRLIEWRDTREQRQSAATPRLLRAS